MIRHSSAESLIASNTGRDMSAMRTEYQSVMTAGRRYKNSADTGFGNPTFGYRQHDEGDRVEVVYAGDVNARIEELTT